MFPQSFSGQESDCNAGDTREMQIRKISEEDITHSNILCLENPLDRGLVNYSPGGERARHD